jgi:hypothetical protein
MKLIIATIIFLLLMPFNSYAFLGKAKDMIKNGTLEMTDLGDNQYDCSFQCPPFGSRQKSYDTWKKQVSNFCGGDFKIIEKRFEKNYEGADNIFATIECLGAAKNNTSKAEKKPAPTNTQQSTRNNSVPKPSSSPEKNREDSINYAEKQSQPREANDYIVLLKSDDPESIRECAKEIYSNNLNKPELLDTVEEILISNHRQDRGDVYSDAMGWLCKILGSSGEEKYRPTLEKVADDGSTFKLRWHASAQRDKLPKLAASNIQEKTPTSNANLNQNGDDLQEKLGKLKRLREQNLITDSEYSQKKADILEQL